jgi:replicative DNA helicase
MSGIPTGFDKLDLLTSGWQPSDLVILAARPGMGKTAFVMSMAKNMAIDFNHPVAIFSLEMSSVQLITRMISSETGISSEKLRKGNLETYEWEALNVKVKKLSEAPIFIDDTPSLSVFDLRAKARRLVSQHDVKAVIIDYLQLMTAGSTTKSTGNREQEISTISRNLKALAKELNVPVIALSQLSRAVETRGGSKRPLLSDLRESGAIEQDADIVSFIYRPEYYGLTEWDDEERTPCEGQAEFIVAKHRNGGLENIRMKFIGRLAKFANLEEGFETEFQSSMNNDSISPSNFNSANEAFGQMDNDDVPF